MWEGMWKVWEFRERSLCNSAGNRNSGSVEKPAEWAVQWAVAKGELLHLLSLQVLCPPSPPAQSCHCLRFKAKRDPCKSLKRSHWPNMRRTKPSWISCISLWKYCLCFSRLAVQLELILAGYAFAVIPGNLKIWIPFQYGSQFYNQNCLNYSNVQ